MDALTRIGHEIHDLCEQIDMLDRDTGTGRAAARQELHLQLARLYATQEWLLAENPAAAEMPGVDDFLTAEEFAATVAAES